MSEKVKHVVTLERGPMDGQRIKWSGQRLIRFEDSCYLIIQPDRDDPPSQMIYIGEARSSYIVKPEASHAG